MSGQPDMRPSELEAIGAYPMTRGPKKKKMVIPDTIRRDNFFIIGRV